MMATQRGFTLIEVMLVVIILGVVASAVVMGLNFNNDLRRLEHEGRRMAALLDLAMQDATLQSRDLGVQLQGDGTYRFLRYDDDVMRWRVLEQDNGLRQHALPEDMRMTLLPLEQTATASSGSSAAASSVAGAGAARSGVNNRAGSKKDDGPQPEATFYATGDVTPVQWCVSMRAGHDASWCLQMDEVGNLHLPDTAEPSASAVSGAQPPVPAS